MASDEPRSFGALQGVSASRRPPFPSPKLSSRFYPRLARIVGGAMTCALLIGLSATFIDRPVSTWLHNHLGDARFAFFTMSYETHPLPVGPFSFMALPAEVLGRLAVLTLVVLAGAAALGWRPTGRSRTVAVLSLSILSSIEVNREAKLVFGRTWPESWLGDNPSWIRDGVFGFFPFHGGPGWGSFPSGHTTIVTTLATLLWIVAPELRPLWVAMVCVVVTGLLGGNYHFISDIIGGLYLGVAVGLGSAGLMLSPTDRLRG